MTLVSVPPTSRSTPAFLPRPDGARWFRCPTRPDGQVAEIPDSAPCLLPLLSRGHPPDLPGQRDSRVAALFAAWRYDIAGPVGLTALGVELRPSSDAAVGDILGPRASARRSSLEEANRQAARRSRDLGRRLYEAVGVLPWAAFPGGVMPADWQLDEHFCRAVDDWRLRAATDPTREVDDDFIRQIEASHLAVDPEAGEQARAVFREVFGRIVPPISDRMQEQIRQALLVQQGLEPWAPPLGMDEPGDGGTLRAR